MPRHDLNDVPIAPGFYTEQSDRGARNRWKHGNLVRFRFGLPERFGGWKKAIQTQFQGICRGLHDWTTESFQRVVGMGTHLKLYLVQGGTLYDITPLRESGTLTNPFSTTSGSAIVDVADVGHGLAINDFVNFSGASAVGGITVDGAYQATAITDSDNYQVTHSSTASSTAGPGGGVVTYSYEIAVGAQSTTAGLGWGAGTWGSGTWGTPRTSSNILFQPRTWSLENWGEDLIANPRGGGIYLWDASAASPFATRAALLSGAPASANFVMMSIDDRHLIAYGAHDGVAADPMLIRWSDQENNTEWSATSTNTAGDKQLEIGSEIMSAERAAREIMVFTDEASYAQFFTGPPDTFGFTYIGDEGRIRGPHASASYKGFVFWMGDQEFYFYDGRINVLPCDVRSYVFDDIDVTQRHKVYASPQVTFNEILWLYPSASGTGECDRYVAYNYRERVWYYGNLDRTAWHKISPPFSQPYATGSDNYLYTHEDGVQADGVDSLGEFIESWDIEAGQGSEFVEAQRVIPDFIDLNGSVTLTLTGKRYPHSSTTKTKGPYTITSTTEKVPFRMRARQISMRIDGISGFWRMAPWRTSARPHGRK